jgi:hypothetical protein
MRQMSDGPGTYLKHLSAAAKQNPVPLALVGVGLGWLMLGSNDRAEDDRPKGGKAKATDRDGAPRLPSSGAERSSMGGQGEGDGGFEEQARERAEAAASETRARIDRTRTRMGEVSAEARSKIDRARENARRRAHQARHKAMRGARKAGRQGSEMFGCSAIIGRHHARLPAFKDEARAPAAPAGSFYRRSIPLFA